MGHHETHGKVENLKGRVKEAAGIVTGDSKLEREGARQRVTGKVEEKLGKAASEVSEAVEEIGKAIKKSDSERESDSP